MRLCLLLCSASLILGQTNPAPPAPIKRLERNIQRITQSINAEWGIYIKCLETGEEISLDADRQMDTMSVIKLPLLAEAFRQIEAGKFSLTDKVILTAAAKRPGTGIIRTLDDGAVLTVKDLLTLMIILSDNTATDLIFEKVGGPEPVNRLMADWGLTATKATGTADVWFKALRAESSSEVFYRNAKTPFGLSSAHDIGKLLERMEKGQAVSKTSSEAMLRIMRGQVYSSRLPRYVSGFSIPHKTGDFLPYIGNDVGVLESPSRHVIISVFTAKHYGAGVNLEDAVGRIAELAGNYFAQRQ